MNPTDTMPPEIAEAARVLKEWQAAHKTPRKRKKHHKPREIKPETADAIFANINTRGFTPIRNRAILALMEASGLRVSEALSLVYGEVELLDAGVYRVEVPDAEGCKSGFRVSYFPAFINGNPTRAHVEIQRWLKKRGERPGLFFWTSKRTPVARQSLNRAWLQYQERAGISGAKLHDLRRTFATRQVRSGVEPDAVRSMMGHADLRSTAIYWQTDEARLMSIAVAQTGTTQSVYREPDTTTVPQSGQVSAPDGNEAPHAGQ